MTISPAQAVIDNEIISYAKRFHRGIETDSESLGLEVIREVGIAGSFLEVEHTLKRFRSEFFQPSILFRNRHRTWEQTGSKRLDQRAEEVADQLMARPVRTSLAKEQILELDSIASDFLRSVRNNV